MLSIKNRGQLLTDSELIPLVEQMVTCLGFGNNIRSIVRDDAALRHIPGWIVFSGAKQLGMAFNLEGLVLSKSNLRLRINHIQQAQQVVAGFGGRDAFPLWLSGREDCPVDWPLYRVSVGKGVILCSASSPAPVFTSQRQVTSARLPISVSRLTHVTLIFTGYLVWNEMVSVGESHVIQSLRVECAQQRWVGVITVSQEGVMNIQSKDTCKSDPSNEHSEAHYSGVVVRLDIGEIKLSLQELVALRSGTAIEIQAEMPLRCFMQVGVTTLAQGELSIEDHGLVLRVTEVASAKQLFKKRID